MQGDCEVFLIMWPYLPPFLPLFVPLFLLDIFVSFCSGIAMQDRWMWRILLTLQVFFSLLLIIALNEALPHTLFPLAIATACFAIETISLYYSSRGKYAQLAFGFSIVSNVLLLLLGFILLGIMPF